MAPAMAQHATYNQRKMKALKALAPMSRKRKLVSAFQRGRGWIQKFGRSAVLGHGVGAGMIGLAGQLAAAAGNMELKSLFPFATGHFSAPIYPTANTNIYGMVPYRFLVNGNARGDAGALNNREGTSVRYTRFTMQVRSKWNALSTAMYDKWHFFLVCLRSNPSNLNWTDNAYQANIVAIPVGS